MLDSFIKNHYLSCHRYLSHQDILNIDIKEDKNLENIIIKFLNSSYKNSDKDICDIIIAYSLAKKYHCNQFRKSKEPYIVHPISVTNILMSIDTDPIVIVSALMHDLIEDTECTYSTINFFLEKR